MPDIAALDRLISQLNTSGLAQRNNDLYQVIKQLIQFLRQTIDSTTAQITAVTPPSTTTTVGTIINVGSGLFPPAGFDLEFEDPTPFTSIDLYP